MKEKYLIDFSSFTNTGVDPLYFVWVRRWQRPKPLSAHRNLYARPLPFISPQKLRGHHTVETPDNKVSSAINWAVITKVSDIIQGSLIASSTVVWKLVRHRISDLPSHSIGVLGCSNTIPWAPAAHQIARIPGGNSGICQKGVLWTQKLKSWHQMVSILLTVRRLPMVGAIT